MNRRGLARLIIGAQAVVLLAPGLALFLAPEQAASIWPWPLTPLTGRATGAWLIGGGLLDLGVLRTNDWPRARPAMA